ncbi:hypothetical protein [Shewanella algidipiscicola]|uniref:KfrA N-terminal DNA-binding domain-containing protein n=1 Tax=Shewanella algidipiscicola TaxID=614070 RepID=A0ABQ4NT36_9GAMM|nr:hypothetical protein [Shewanella algidipiscicola]GIU02584.1 hypothetical protein TUM4630_34520 [Shewanella algidipiscicola]
MTPIEQVLAVAKTIVDSGKTPSLALIKSKLGNSLPMPVLIQGIQRFKALSKEEVAALDASYRLPVVLEQSTSAETALAQLQQQVHALTQQQQELINRISALEAKLTQRDHH